MLRLTLFVVRVQSHRHYHDRDQAREETVSEDDSELTRRKTVRGLFDHGLCVCGVAGILFDYERDIRDVVAESGPVVPFDGHITDFGGFGAFS
jgi:hypothetical protein